MSILSPKSLLAVTGTVLLLGSLLLVPLPALAASPIDERVAALLPEVGDAPGCAVGLQREGEWVFRGAYGLASLEHSVPIDAETVFFLSSMSKQFVAASAFLAAQRGLLDLDDDIADYLPELPRYPEPVRVRQLIHHTAGIPDYLMLMALADMPFENVHTDARILDLLARQPKLSHAPGEKYLYGNGNYWILGQVVARAAGESLREFAERELFGPLEMTSTHFHDRRRHVVANRAFAYDEIPDVGGWQLDFHTAFERVGASGVLSSLDDLGRWATFLATGGERLPGLVPFLLTTGRLDDGSEVRYAGGLVPSSYRGLPTWTHSGAFMGFRSIQVHFFDQATSITVLCNSGRERPYATAMRIADVVLADDLEPVEDPPETSGPAPETPEPYPAGDLSEFEGRYYSEALDVVHTYTARDGELVLTLELDPKEYTSRRVSDTTFRGFLYTVEFERDAEGRVTGLVMDAGRIYDQEFRRLSPPDAP